MEQNSLSGSESISEKILIAIARPLAKLRAMQNYSARFHADLHARIFHFTPENWEAWVAQERDDAEIKTDELIYSLSVLYNPVGKIIASVANPGYDKYVLRISDLMGISRLARLQVALVAADKNANIPALIAADKKLYDPYTGKPMSWDANKRQLVFDTQGNNFNDSFRRIKAGI